MRRASLALAGMLLCGIANGQTDGILQINDPVHRFLERQTVLGNIQGAFLSHQPLSAYEARQYLDTLDNNQHGLTPNDRALLHRFRRIDGAPGARWGNDRVGALYANGHDFLSFTGDGYAVQINPLLYLSYGIAKQSARPDRDDQIPVWQNTRGLRVSGNISDRFFFETRYEENQVRLPELAGPTSGARRGFAYRSDDNTFDYGIATGVIGYRSKLFEIRFGQDRHRWGRSQGSLVLSNYSPPFAFLQLRTTIGPLQYTNLFASLQDSATPRGEGELARPFKYGAFHRLAINASSRLEFGLFESVILAPTQNERNPGFYFTFFNPVVLYHTLNLDIGSPGNVLLGADVSWLVRDGVRLEGQFFIDDFESSQFFSNPGYWKNTYGFQTAVEVADLGLRDMRIRIEYTQVRPYSYSNRTAPLGYTNRLGFLGFPLGPNVRDLAIFGHYRLTPRLAGAFSFSVGARGRNTGLVNYGSDPFVPYDENRPGDEGIELLQGIRQDLVFFEGRIEYELLPALTLDAVLRYQSVRDADTGLDRYVNPFLSIRWGLPFQSQRY